MERLMSSLLRQKIATVNAGIGVLLADTRRALTGEREFGVEQVRALSEPIREMAPAMQRATELRALQPEIAGELDLYKQQLGELHTALEQVRMMLQAKRTQMEAGRVQLEAVSQWAAVLRQTQ
jgi:hypothetical protein